MGKKRLKPTIPKSKKGVKVTVVDARGAMLQTDEDQQEYKDQLKFVSVNSSTANHTPNETQQLSEKSEENEIKLSKALDEVKKLGSSVLKKWEKSEWKRKQEAALGFAPAKQLKMPLKRLVGMRKKNEFRENFQRRKDRGLGLTVKKKVKIRELEKHGDAGVNAGGRSKNRNKNSIGAFKNGVLVLNKNMGRELNAKKQKMGGALHSVLGGTAKRRKF